MARSRDEKSYTDTRTKLLDVGMNLIRAGSYASVGINDVLRASGTPKGSFYHYFQRKEMFGLEVAKHYYAELLESTKNDLQNSECTADVRLKAFFQTAHDDFEDRGFANGCLMCNLSTELANEYPDFQELLGNHWRAVSSEITNCIAELDKSDIGLEHLTDEEAGDWLLNSWSGALTRVKAVRDGEPLRLFLKTTFRKGK
jgi:TetR/AcrR family transcriptional repressor of nem operon